jgi:hypothetical protein
VDIIWWWLVCLVDLRDGIERVGVKLRGWNTILVNGDETWFD